MVICTKMCKILIKFVNFNLFDAFNVKMFWYFYETDNYELYVANVGTRIITGFR